MSPRSTVRRLPQRATYSRNDIFAILDAGRICHVGLVDAGQPVVIPMAYARHGDRVLLHGSARSRLLQALAKGERACVTVTLIDGLVLARSVFHHSMNYRSVVILGNGRGVDDREQKREALQVLVDHLAPGRWNEARQPSAAELEATTVVEFPLDEASAKVRTGPPQDPPADLDLPVWAGELPLHLARGAPRAAPDLRHDLPPPACATGDD